MSTFDPTILIAGSALIPQATNPTTAGIVANGTADGYCNLAGAVRTGAGVTTLPLRGASVPAGSSADGLSNLEHHALMTIRANVGNTNGGLAWTSQVLLTIATFVVAAATDEDYDVTIFRTRRVA